MNVNNTNTHCQRRYSLDSVFQRTEPPLPLYQRNVSMDSGLNDSVQMHARQQHIQPIAEPTSQPVLRITDAYLYIPPVTAEPVTAEPVTAEPIQQDKCLPNACRIL